MDNMSPITLPNDTPVDSERNIKESVSMETNKSKKTSASLLWPIAMWGLAALFYFYDYLLQVSPSAMKPELTAAFGINAEEFGSLSAYFLYAYGIMQIPAGMLLDRFGPRRVITIACIFCALGSLFFGAAESLWLAKLGRIMIGGGAGFALLSCLKLANCWLPKNRYALMSGLTVTVGFLGAAFGLSSVSEITNLISWRETLNWAGIIGLTLSVVLWLVIRDKKAGSADCADNAETSCDTAYNANATNANTQKSVHHSIHNANTQDHSETLQGILQGFLIILKSKQTWIASLFAGLMFVPTLAFGGLWGIPFLVEAHGFERAVAGHCASLIYIGWVCGGAFWGLLSDYLGKRMPLLFISNLGLLVVTVIIIYMQGLPLIVLQTLLFGLGFFCSAFILSFAIITEINPPSLAATANGFGNALNTLWGALAQPLIGLILDMNCTVTHQQTQLFSLAEYQHAFLTLPICLIVSFLFLLFLKEPRTQN